MASSAAPILNTGTPPLLILPARNQEACTCRCLVEQDETTAEGAVVHDTADGQMTTNRATADVYREIIVVRATCYDSTACENPRAGEHPHEGGTLSDVSPYILLPVVPPWTKLGVSSHI